MNDCLACQSMDSKELCLHSKYPARQCLQCGFVWTPDVKGSKELYESAYNDQQEGFTWDDFLRTHECLKQGQPVGLHWYEEDFLKAVSPFAHKRLLEIGCSTGRFLNVCQKAGWDIHGLDISEKAARLTSDLFPHADIKCGTMDDEPWDEDFFNVLASWEVIEHVDDPFDFVCKANQLLKKEGILTLSTPDWGSWAIQRHPMLNYWPPYHIWFFNEKSMTAMLQRAGFEVIRIKRNLLPWSETCWSKKKRFLALPFLIWKGIILRQGGGRLVVYAKKK